LVREKSEKKERVLHHSSRARSREGSVAVGRMDGAYVSSRVAATAFANGRDS